MGLFGDRKKVAFLIEREHLFGSATYECSHCGAVYSHKAQKCHRCGAEFTKTGYDPKWVDELEALDAIFDD